MPDKITHIGDPRFGLQQDYIDKLLEFCMHVPKKLNGYDAQIILEEYYEAHMGIFNHAGLSKSRPLSTVAFHDSEDINKDSLLESSLIDFAGSKIHEFFGYNFSEFSALPSDICKMIRQISLDLKEKQDKIDREREKRLGELIPPTENQ